LNPDSVSPDQDYFRKARLVTPPKIVVQSPKKDVNKLKLSVADTKIPLLLVPKLHTMLRVMDPFVTHPHKEDYSDSDNELIVHESWQKPSKTLSVSPRKIQSIDINKVQEIKLLDGNKAQ